MIRGSKVCILTTVHLPFDTRIFHKQAKTLVEAGYDVTLIVQYDKNEVVDGVKIVPLGNPRNRFTRIFGLTWRAFRLALRQHADIYHFHDPELLAIAPLLKLFSKGNIIYDVHEDYPAAILTKRWLPSYLRRTISLFFRLVESWLSSTCDAVVTVNEQILQRLSHKRGVVATNFPILHDTFLIEKKEHPAGRPFTCIYHGGLTRINGILETLQALDILNRTREVRLVLLGPVKDAELAGEIEASSAAEYLGFVSHEDVWGNMREADVGLALYHPVPNALWSRPNKLFEYMMAGLPVVASNMPGWQDFVEREQCGILVDPKDLYQITRAIEHLMNHPEERHRMGENGRRAVLEKYNWSHEAKKLLALYKELLDEDH